MNQVTREEFLALVAHQDAIDAEIRAIRLDIEQVRIDTHEVVEMFRALSGGFKVVQWLGRCARYLTYIFAAIAAAVVAFKNGWFK